MKVTIYFKDCADKKSITIENLTDIYAKEQSFQSRQKHYNEENFFAFMPYPEESYSFQSATGNISIFGSEILCVEFSQQKKEI